MKIAILNDTHFGVRNASDIFIEHQKQFFSNVFFPYLKENDIDTIFHLGDLLDNRRALNPKALYEMRKMFLEPLRENKIHCYIIAGNHDLYHKDRSEVSGLKEAIGFFTDSVTLIQEPLDTLFGSTLFGWVPWINQSNEKKSFDYINKKSKADVLLGHFELNGFEMHSGQMCSNGVKKEKLLFDRFDKVLTGHFHHKSSKDNIHYLGSQFQLTFNDVGDQKFFHVVDTETRHLEAIQNPYSLFYQTKYEQNGLLRKEDFHKKFVRLAVYEKPDLYEYDKTIALIESFEPYDLTIQDYSLLIENEKEMEDMDLDSLDSLSWKDTLVFSNKFIDSNVDLESSHLDKDTLKRIFGEIYSEANSILEE